ncbi:MAG: TetR/AcrR family transcriptional regulator [Propionibacteriaceae bacterium]|jgi:AcrR family transcriptional regulator|nr:TetR/AcrR family transcriptional regulator [Propionibacteriaceae bacterium]
MKTRVVKQAEVRRDEILDAASRLFTTKGYEATTISDLLDAVGIARGTLYHHFRSKENVLDGLIRRHGDQVLAGLREVVASGLSTPEKLLACIAALAPQDPAQAALVDELGRASDSALFSKTLDDIVIRLAPVIAEAVADGVAAGVLHTAYPVEASRILLVAAYALLDNRTLEWADQDRAVQFAALLDAAERVLGAEPGSLSSLAGGGGPRPAAPS